MRRCVVVLLVITATVVAAADWTELTRAGEWAFSRGDFSPLLGWLRDKVHAHGSRWEPAELVERASGAPPSADALVAHLESRFPALYS